MRPPAGHIFLLCINCDRLQWQRDTDPARVCRWCAGITEERDLVGLRGEDRQLLKQIATWTRQPMDAAVAELIHAEIRRLATERAGKGKSVPQWIAEWLQKHRGE